jgi:glycosyltransferase involved in cell wall biosynthesis
MKKHLKSQPHAPELRKISVVLGTLNRLPYLQATIESIRRSTCSLPIEIIVVDGGSSDGSLRWLAEQKDVITIIQHNIDVVDGKKVRKKSWGYFMNLGFKIAQGELICMISDDSVLHPDALEQGVATYRCAVAAGKNIGGIAFRWRSYPEETNYRVGYTLGGKMFVNHGFYVRDALQAVGWLEEEALKFYFADGDVCLKLADHGYEVICGEDSHVEHFEIPKQSSPNVSTALIESEWGAYLERWAKLKDSDGVLAIGHFDYKDSAMDPSELKKLIPPCVTTDLARAAAKRNPRSNPRALLAFALRKLVGKKKQS